MVLEGTVPKSETTNKVCCIKKKKKPVPPEVTPSVPTPSGQQQIPDLGVPKKMNQFMKSCDCSGDKQKPVQIRCGYSVHITGKIVYE